MIFFSAETGTCLSNRTYTATHIYMIFSSYVYTQSFIVFGGLLEFYSLCFFYNIILYVFLFQYRLAPTGRIQSINQINQSINQLINQSYVWRAAARGIPPRASRNE